ncbi:MAG: NADH-quinone oxidoreductase subunit L [Acidimicrobiales bacterium]|nr:NADH-quinone oxidoreductase subunit L [Acidimicrobiales bacterium]
MLAAEAGAAASAGWFLENAWLFPAVPFVSFLLILFFGRKMPKQGAEIGITALAIVFAGALIAGAQWISHVNAAESAHGTEETHSTDETHGTEEEGHSTEPGTTEDGTHSEEGTSTEESHDEGALAVSGGGRSVVLGPSLALPMAEEGGEAHASVPPVISEWKSDWWTVGGIDFQVGTFVDGQAVMMLFVVGLISLLVHIYSTDYVHGDIRYTHFFAFLSLFTASMLLLVLANNLVMFITAWELVGVCSFALIGHWWEEQNNSNAALKAFLTNRVGDMGLLIGMITLFFTAGQGRTFNIYEINVAAASGTVSDTALTVAALCLLAAVMSKSGQFFLHTWLPDAMAGPTPVSALIHAATMVVAGVYMIARMYPVFFEGMSIAGGSINAVALIGAITTMVGGSLAFVQRDIKKVLAYSTVSQLGYMVMALGVGAWTAAMFHLMTHAFFKACLFLGSGSVSHACNHSFDMKTDMGGLRKYMPKTHATFLVGTLALAGFPLMSGFWSKDEILAGTGGFGLSEGANGRYSLMLVMGLITGGMTAAYMTRCYWLTFMGEWRGANSPNAHHGAHAAAHDDHDAHAPAGHDAHDAHDAHGGLPHESGPRITTPLLILAVLAFVAMFANIPGQFGFVPEGWRLRFEHYIEPKGEYFPAISHAEFSPVIAILSLIAAAVASGLAVAYYRKVEAQDPMGTELVDGPTSKAGLPKVAYNVLANKFYLDWLYTDVIVGFVKGPLARAANWFNQNVLDGIVNGTATVSKRIAGFTYTVLDQQVVDGVVRGSGIGASETGGLLRRMQNGRVQGYAALMFAAAAVLAGVFVLAI